MNLERTSGGLRLLVTVLWAALAWSPAWGPGLALASGDKVLLKNEIPYGEREGGLLAQGAGISSLLCVESRAHRDLRVELGVHVPGPLVAGSDDGRLRISRNENDAVVEAVFPLRVEGEKWFSSFSITVPHETPVGEYVVHAVARVRDEDGEEVVEQVTRLMVVSRDVIPALFRVGDPVVPCNEKGEPEDRLERSTVLIQGRKTFWQKLVEDGKRTSRFDTRPSTYLSVPVRNTGPYKAILLVRMDVLDPATGERVPGFELPHAAEHGDALGEVAVYQVVEMDPESEERVVLPIYVSEEAVRPGIYSARIRTVLFGTDIEADNREVSVRVVGVRRLPALMTAVALLTSLGGMLFALGQRKRCLAMQGRDLILIALFGTVMFTVVTIPGTLFLHAAHILLGPLSFLVTGFFNEILFYLLLVSLVVLIPRPGAVSLVVAVRFLMSSFVLGEFSPLSVLYHATTAACLEAAVSLSGLSRARPDGGPALFGRRRILLAAVVLGVTDAFLSFAFFNLSMFFYRLYYATWYLAAYLVINGFLFTFIAVPFGFKLGGRLKATANV